MVTWFNLHGVVQCPAAGKSEVSKAKGAAATRLGGNFFVPAASIIIFLLNYASVEMASSVGRKKIKKEWTEKSCKAHEIDNTGMSENPS